MIPKKMPNMNTKPAKYFVARKKGKNKTEAKLEAGYALTTPASQIERSEVFQEVEKRFYGDVLLSKVTMDELAAELIKNIKQDADRGAKNTAIKIALERIEPETNPDKSDDQVIVVLKQ
jgi:hypothetical protein